MLRLHIRLLHIDHDQVRLLAGSQAIAVIQSHRPCAVCCRHLQHCFCRNGCRIHLFDLAQPRHEKHLSEEIEAIVARRSVSTDRHRYVCCKQICCTADPAGKLQIGSRIGHGIQIMRFKYFYIFLIHMNTVEAASAVIKHSDRIEVFDRSQTVMALLTLSDFLFCFGQMHIDRRRVFVRELRH